MSKADSTQTALTAQIAEELKGRTSKEEAITSGELAKKLDVGDTEANPKTREMVREVMKNRDIPIVSCHAGYWVPSSEEEIAEELESIDGRIASMQQRKKELVGAFNRKKYGEDQ